MSTFDLQNRDAKAMTVSMTTWSMTHLKNQGPHKTKDDKINIAFLYFIQGQEWLHGLPLDKTILNQASV